jgi:hypothetical protein
MRRATRMTATPNDLHSVPPPGSIVVGTPDREGREFVGVDGLTIYLVQFVGGKTNLRFNRCSNVRVLRCPKLSGVTGPADPDGQCIQIIDPQGPHSIERSTLVASDKSEDMINVIGDEPCPPEAVVSIVGLNWQGRGVSDSSTSLCMDGPHCPPVHVTGGLIANARCGITIAGGAGHVIDRVAMAGCGTKIYIFRKYPGGPWGNFTLRGYTRDDVLIGEGASWNDVRLLAA